MEYEAEAEEIMLMSTHMSFLMCHPVCGSRNDRDAAAADGQVACGRGWGRGWGWGGCSGQSVDPWPSVNPGSITKEKCQN